MNLAKTIFLGGKHLSSKAKIIVVSAFILACLAVWLFVYRSGPETGESSSQPGLQVAPANTESGGQAAARPAAPVGAEIEPSAAAGAGERDKLQVVRRFGWGDKPGQLGHKIPDEGAPEGPMSFVVDKGGRLVVLDQVNSRVQIFDPDMQPASIELPAETFQDIGTDADGNPVLLDRLARRSIESYSPGGKLLYTVPIEGPGVPEGGGVTGMFVQDDGTWLEVEHSRLVRVADAQGRPADQRTIVPGRLSGDGKAYLAAGRSGRQSASVMSWPTANPNRPPVLVAKLQFDMQLAAINALESDPAGRIYLGALLVDERPGPPPAISAAFEEIVLLNASGAAVQRIRLPVNTGPEEQFRPIRLGADGELYRLRCTADGAILERWIP